MNILINSYCNLKCPYCFADPTMKESETKNMSKESFIEVLNFLKRNGEEEVRLIGGEPTLHPELETFIDLIILQNCFRRITVFSNFTFNEKIANMFIKKSEAIEIGFLPNINEYELILPTYRQRIEANLALFAEKLQSFHEIGINIYYPGMDYKQWEDIIEKYEDKIHYLRFCIAIPTQRILENNFDFYEYYNSFESDMVRLAEMADRHNIYLSIDCNNLPVCCFSKETINRLILTHPEMLTSDMSLHCGYPVIDVKPDLSLAGCFGFYIKGAEQKYLKDFRSIEDILEYFNKIGSNDD